MINLLSVVDLLITLSVLRLGATELNPLMAWLFDLGPIPAAAAKIGVVLAATLGLWRLRRHRAALSTAVAALRRLRLPGHLRDHQPPRLM